MKQKEIDTWAIGNIGQDVIVWAQVAHLQVQVNSFGSMYNFAADLEKKG